MPKAKNQKNRDKTQPACKKAGSGSKKRSLRHSDEVLKYELDFVFNDMVTNMSTPTAHSPLLDSDGHSHKDDEKVELELDDALLKLSSL